MNLVDFQEDFLKFDIRKAVEFAINNSSEKLEDLQVEQQYAGLKEDGNEIVPFYTESTVNDKRRRGKVFTNVTLEQDGFFHKRVIVFSENFVINFTSLDWKTKILEEKYGAEIFGLNYDYTVKSKEFLLPLIKDYYEIKDR